MGIAQVLTRYDNPKGNADTERVMRIIIKSEEIIWRSEFGSFEEAEKVGKWIEVDYNRLYLRSKPGYISPEEFEAKYEKEYAQEAA